MALVQHRISKCSNLKESLQGFVLKRLKTTNHAIDIKDLWSKEEKKHELTPTEIERIKARRLQNKHSAQKSRQKSKTKIELLEKEFQELVKMNQNLMMEINRLKQHISNSRIEILKSH